MSSFYLRPLNGEKDIVVPFGKTTIGRGPLLGVTDKRVSRSHAVLEVEDENLTILPLHINPTFLKSSDGKKFVSLKKGKTRVLIDGDVIALLPDSVCFMVVCQGDSLENGVTEEQVGISKNKMLDKLLTKSNKAHDKEKPTKSSDTPTDMLLDEFMNTKPSLGTFSADAFTKHANVNFTSSKPSNQDTITANSSFSVIEKDVIPPYRPLVEPAPLLQKTRKLPSWLIESTSQIKSPAKNSVNRRGRTLVSQNVEKKTAADNKERNKITWREKLLAKEEQKVSGIDEDFTMGDDDESEHLKDRGKNKFAKKRSSTSIEDNEEDVKPTESKKTRTSRILGNENDVYNEPSGPKSKKDICKTFSGDTDTGGSDDEMSASKVERTQMKENEKESDKMKLPPCPYGKKCYRKNPLHFKEYLHPDKDSSDDDDDKVAGDDSDDYRPVCPYGSSCYRQNPQHRKDFEHTDAVGPKHKTTKKRKNLDGTSDDDGHNTYDYNDSFLADDASDVKEDGSSYSGSDDPDWQPVQGDDNGKEDVNQLLHEAKGFLCNKKMTKPV